MNGWNMYTVSRHCRRYSNTFHNTDHLGPKVFLCQVCQHSVQPCSAGCVELPFCVLSSPEPIQLLLQFVYTPSLVRDVITTPVSLWHHFQLYVTFFAEKSNTCACVEHSYDWFILPGAVGADVKHFLQWGTKQSCSKITMCPVGGPNALSIAEISTVLTVWAATVLVCLLITSLQATCSRWVLLYQTAQ